MKDTGDFTQDEVCLLYTSTQSLARELAREETLTLVCGRYEGIDARLMDILPVEQVSVGEAVLNGGEAAAMMLVEAATRLIPGLSLIHI